MPRKKTLEYRNVEQVICNPIDERTNDCNLMYTPEKFPQSIPMNMDTPIRPNIIRLSEMENCIVIRNELKCIYDYEEGQCRYYDPLGSGNMVLECGAEILD